LVFSDVAYSIQVTLVLEPVIYHGDHAKMMISIPALSPTIRQISSLKIPVILDLNRSLQGFDKPGVADVSFRYPFDICNNFIDFDSW